ncbi:lectin subunit alpha-like [Aedes albopictus]|uniref:C-type lectin domain-containing protein n=1 Tax=Aedes albopictus TaxID=7160 RepID=A0ABM1ZUG2_AEDAL|nr:lectin subunit alpha-like [Aedes albopictus]
MAFLRFGILLAVISVAVSQELFCSSPSTFYIPDVKANWIAAVHHCNRLGMRLAVVEAEWKQTEIVRLARSSHMFLADVTSFDLWIGANDMALEGKFIWHATGLPLGYTNWKKNEPNNLHTKEHCVHMWYLPSSDLYWDWNDLDCENSFYFVCENVGVQP